MTLALLAVNLLLGASMVSGVAPPRTQFRIDPTVEGLKHDGYVVEQAPDGALTVRGKRPRSLFFAAGEVSRWANAKSYPFVRDPFFATRALSYGKSIHPLREWIAATGCNLVQVGRDGAVTLEKSMPEVFERLSAKDRESLVQRNAEDRERLARLVRECAAADVPAYQLLYGCDASKWSKPLLDALLAAHPSAAATPPVKSWEKGILCPSDQATWTFLSAYAAEIAQLAPFEGLIVTFWDDYGLNCKCARCRKLGLDRFGNQIAVIIACYERALRKLGKKLIVRTWSSGAPHDLKGEWVHAPGYAGVEDAFALWGKTFEYAAKGTVFQTKVYNCDCQPNPPFSNLLGRAEPHREFAEWQITGQTVGRQWLPASVVNHTAKTMRRAAELVGAEGGVFLYAGRYKNPGYEALDDIANSVNVHAWRQLSWNPEEDIDGLWREWAQPIYSNATESVIAALRETEAISVAAFSPLGLGAPTESEFARTIKRREDLLRYTNRHYLPEGKAALEPTLANVVRVGAEKDDALRRLDGAIGRLEVATNAGDLDPEKSAELLLRLRWMRTHLFCSRILDLGLWRLRYLKELPPGQQAEASIIHEVREDFRELRRETLKLFEHDPKMRMSFYPDALGEHKISLGSPIPLMREIMAECEGGLGRQ